MTWTGLSKRSPRSRYCSGLTVPVSGVYAVTHSVDPFPDEIALEAGMTFPGCAHCGDFLRFELVRVMSEQDAEIAHDEQLAHDRKRMKRAA